MTSTGGTWNGTSSYIEAGGTGTPTITVGITDSYGKPIEHGTMLVVRKVDNDATGIVVDWSNEFSDSAYGGLSTKLRNRADACLLLFKGPSASNNKGEWVNLTADTFEGLFTGALTINGSAQFGNAYNDRTHILDTGWKESTMWIRMVMHKP